MKEIFYENITFDVSKGGNLWEPCRITAGPPQDPAGPAVSKKSKLFVPLCVKHFRSMSPTKTALREEVGEVGGRVLEI